MKKLAVFDMDGTLLDTLEDITDGLNDALAKHGFPLVSTEHVRTFIGNGVMEEVRHALPPKTNEKIREQVFAAFNAYYEKHNGDKTRPYEGIVEVIRQLRKAGMKTAVVSNKVEYAVSALQKQYFPGLFDVALGEKEGIRRKPAPDMINAVLSRLGVEQSDAVYIGDSEVDILTARQAGIDLIMVEWGYRAKEAMTAMGAKVFAADPQQLAYLLKEK